MLKLPITYKGTDGKEKTKEFFFNLTKGEIAEIHLAIPGGLDGFMNHLENDTDVEPEDVVRIFKEIIIKSYGKRTSDGKFIKNQRLCDEFAASDAYSELFLKFINNENNFSEKFLEGVLEMNLVDAKKIIEETPKEITSEEDIDSL